MIEKIFKRVIVVGCVFLLSLFAINLLGVTASADDETPPSLVLNIMGDGAGEEAPPELDVDVVIPEEEEEEEEDEADLLTLDADVSPPTFNPNISNTTITYEISKNAKMDVEILNPNGSRLILLVNNQSKTAGEHSVSWNGTNTNLSGGNVVAKGTYTYRVIAKNTSTGVVEATAQGNINVVYPEDTPQAPKAPEDPKDNGTIILQNQGPKATSETGPGILLYLLLPLGGFLFNKRK